MQGLQLLHCKCSRILKISSILFILCPLHRCHLIQHCCYYPLLLSLLLFCFRSLISPTSQIICENVGMWNVSTFIGKFPIFFLRNWLKSNQTALHKDWEIKETMTKLISFRNLFWVRNFCQQKQAYQKHVYYTDIGLSHLGEDF